MACGEGHSGLLLRSGCVTLAGSNARGACAAGEGIAAQPVFCLAQLPREATAARLSCGGHNTAVVTAGVLVCCAAANVVGGQRLLLNSKLPAWQSCQSAVRLGSNCCCRGTAAGLRGQRVWAVRGRRACALGASGPRPGRQLARHAAGQPGGAGRRRPGGGTGGWGVDRLGLCWCQAHGAGFLAIA